MLCFNAVKIRKNELTKEYFLHDITVIDLLAKK